MKRQEGETLLPFSLFTPVLQLGQGGGKIGPGLLRREILAGHVLHQKFQQLVHVFVGEFPVGIAPFAVLLIEAAVCLPDELAVVGEGHAAALADQPPGTAQQRVDGNVEQRGEAPQRIGVGQRFAVFPPGNSLPGDEQSLRQLFLRQSVLVP